MEAWQIDHPRLWKSVKITVLIALLWLLAALLFGFQIHIFDQDPMYSLQRARALWAQKGSDSYRMQMQIGGPWLTGSFHLTIRQGQVVEAEMVQQFLVTPTYAPVPDPANYVITPDFHTYPQLLGSYTIPKLFDLTESILAPLPPMPLVTLCNQDSRYWHVTFDPDLGYLTSLEWDSCYDIGWLCGGMADCSSGIRISNLELLGDES